jgi:hypothetical protein
MNLNTRTNPNVHIYNILLLSHEDGRTSKHNIVIKWLMLLFYIQEHNLFLAWRLHILRF